MPTNIPLAHQHMINHLREARAVLPTKRRSRGPVLTVIEHVEAALALAETIQREWDVTREERREENKA